MGSLSTLKPFSVRLILHCSYRLICFFALLKPNWSTEGTPILPSTHKNTTSPSLKALCLEVPQSGPQAWALRVWSRLSGSVRFFAACWDSPTPKAQMQEFMPMFVERYTHVSILDCEKDLGETLFGTACHAKAYSSSHQQRCSLEASRRPPSATATGREFSSPILPPTPVRPKWTPYCPPLSLSWVCRTGVVLGSVKNMSQALGQLRTCLILIGEFPKLRGPNINPRAVGAILRRTPSKGPLIYRNSHMALVMIIEFLNYINPKHPWKEPYKSLLKGPQFIETALWTSKSLFKRRRYICTHIHTYIHTYIHSYIHSYIHTCI